MTVPLRRNPTQTATQHTVPLCVHELLFCGLPKTLSNFARGLSPQRRWEHAPSLHELTLRYDQWTNIIKTRNTWLNVATLTRAEPRHETPSLVLSVRDPHELPVPTWQKSRNGSTGDCQVLHGCYSSSK